MTYAQKLHLRLFLEGVEVPVVSANIQSTVDQAAVASIQIPFNDYALDIKPRTLVHLFFYDFYRGAPPEGTVSVSLPGVQVTQTPDVDPEIESILSELRINEATTEQIQQDLENENYKLLFGGEVVGIQTAKNPRMRSVVLQCMDWSSYWDYSYQYQVQNSIFGGGIRAAFTGSSTNVFNDFLEGSADPIMRAIERAPRSYPSLRGTLIGALMNIVETIGGTYYGRRAIRGTNDFFSLAEMRLHLTQMVGANPYSNRDERRLLRARGFGSLFRRSLGGLGKQVSIRDILNALKKYIFHDIVPITTPNFIPSPQNPNIPQFETMSLDQAEETRPIARAARRIQERVENIKSRQEQVTDSASARQLARRRGGIRNELRQLSRVATRAAQSASRVGSGSREDGAFDRLFRLEGVVPAFTAAANKLNQLAQRGIQRTQQGSSFYLLGTFSAQVMITQCEQIIAAMEQVQASQYRRRATRTTSQPDPPPRLITQVWRPDVWMTAPPRSNVLFPELYNAFDYNRSFMQETTRLLLRTHSAFFGSDILFDGFYMAPSRLLGTRTNRRQGRGRIGVTRPMDSDAPVHFVRDLMDHELFTGILPKFERMSDLNLHAIRGGSFRSSSGVEIGYAQLAANHIFFKQRFQSRQLSVGGKFNPWLVLGFPTVVIDRRYTAADIELDPTELTAAAQLAAASQTGSGNIAAPGESPEDQAERDVYEAERAQEIQEILSQPRELTHYLGTSANLSHSVSTSGGGSTSIQLGYARTTNEKTEFLGDSRALGRQQRFRRSGNRTVSTVIAWTAPPQVGTRGPRGGNITAVEDVTDRYSRRVPNNRTVRTNAAGRSQSFRFTTRPGQTPRVPLWVPGGQVSGRRYSGTRVRVGVALSASAHGGEVVALVGTIGNSQPATQQRRDGVVTEIQVTFRAYKVTEEIGVYQRAFENIPAEDLVFPPWYGDHWRSTKVGGIYSYLFGTGSIIDPTVFRAPARADTTNNVVPDGGDLSGASSARSQPEEAQPLVDPTTDLPGVGQADHPQTGGMAYGPPGDSESDSVTGAVLGSVEARGTINEAIDELVKVYSRVRFERWDTNEFLRSYTWRPIATMVDLFGTANLEINDDGEVVRGVEGFHSRAFGPYDDLRQLVSNNTGDRPPRILGLTTDDPDDPRTTDTSRAERDAGIAARLDTRREKRTQILLYLRALVASRGILG